MGAIISTAWSRAFLYLHALPLARFSFRHHSNKKESQLGEIISKASFLLSLANMSTSGSKLLPFGYEEVEETGVRRIQKAPQPFSFPLPLARFLFICHGSKKSHNVAKCFLKKPYL